MMPNLSVRVTKAVVPAFLFLVACAPTTVSAAAPTDPDQCITEDVLLNHKVQRVRATAALRDEESGDSAEAPVGDAVQFIQASFQASLNQLDLTKEHGAAERSAQPCDDTKESESEYMLSQLQVTEKVEVQPIPRMHHESVPLVAKTKAKTPTTASEFDDHWISLADMNLWHSTSVMQVYKIADGSQSTWGSAVAFVIDFGTNYHLHRIVVNWRICKCMLAGSLSMQLSGDRENWFDIVSPSGLYAYGDNQYRDYAITGSGRYLRIMPTSVSPLQWISIWEIAIYGSIDARRDNVYGWYESYMAGTGFDNANLMGTEMLHIVAFEGALFAGNGHWKDSGEYQAAQIYRLDCAYCNWQSEGSLSPYVGRIEKMAAITWTTASDGSTLDPPVSLLAATYYMVVSANGRCVLGIRQTGRTWAESPYYYGGIYLPDYFSARALTMYKDSVTGIDGLFLSTGKDGIIRGHYDGTVLIKAEFPDSTETGAVSTRPLGLTTCDHHLYFSMAASIHRRNDGYSPSWSKVFDMNDALHSGTSDHIVIDEGVGGIRGLSSIVSPTSSTGNSLMFAWCPNEDSLGCIYRLDPVDDPTNETNFTFVQETCVTQEFSNHIGRNNLQQPTVASFSIAAYNDILEIEENNTYFHLIGFEVLLWGWSTYDLPIDPEQIGTVNATGRRIAYYAGAGYLVRRSNASSTSNATYEVRVPGGPRYYTTEVFPTFVAVRTMAKSPFSDGGVFMGGYDTNHFDSLNTAWIQKGTPEAVWQDPVPCLPERGCGHVPGLAVTPLGCDLCTGRTFRGVGVAYWYQGNPVTCQTVINLLNTPEHSGSCATASTHRLARVCCRDCNFCLGTGTNFTPDAVAGTSSGSTYTCSTALSYTTTGYVSCFQATRWWQNACCR